MAETGTKTQFLLPPGQMSFVGPLPEPHAPVASPGFGIVLHMRVSKGLCDLLESTLHSLRTGWAGRVTSKPWRLVGGRGLLECVCDQRCQGVDLTVA